MRQTPSPDQFRAFLSRHSLTGSEAGEIVGINGRQIRRYTGGDAKIPYAVWFTLNMKVAGIEV